MVPLNSSWFNGALWAGPSHITSHMLPTDHGCRHAAERGRVTTKGNMHFFGERSLNHPHSYGVSAGEPPQVLSGAFNPPNYQIPGTLPPQGCFCG
jgi:hypothetical protein